jgi:hypothetical protein
MHWRSAQQHASSQGGKKISAGGVHGLQSLLFCAARHNKSREEQRGNAISMQECRRPPQGVGSMAADAAAYSA